MAWVWGDPQSSSSGNAARAGLNVWVTSDGTNATVHADAGFWSRWSCADSANSWTMVGAVSKSGSNQAFNTSVVDSSWSTSNQILGWTSATAVYPIATNAGQTKTVTLTINNVAIAGDQPLTVSASVVIPSSPPAAPSNGTASKPALASGSWATNLGWKYNGTSAAPWDSQRLYRWDNTRTDATYIQIKDLAWSATAYTDATLQLDRHYGYAIVAHNASGDSAWHYFGDVYTPPAAPTNVTAQRSGSNVTGTFVTQSSLPGVSFVVQDSTDGGGTWTAGIPVASGPTKGQTVAYTLTGIAQAKPHLIRVAAKASDGTLSAYTQAPSAVVIISKPNAPTGLTSGVAASGTSVTLTAQPSATVLPDGSAVTAYDWRRRLKGASTWTETGKTTASALSIAVTGYTSGQQVEHQVRVWGAFADPSDWSAVASVTLSAVPTSTITAPTAATLDGDTLVMEATGYDPDGGPIVAARWGIEDVASGASLAPVFESSSELTRHQYPAKLANGTTVRAWVQHQEQHGLWSPKATIVKPVAYVGPAELTVTTQWDPGDNSLGFNWSANAAPGKPAAQSVDVYMLVDGQRVKVASELPPTSAWSYGRAPLVSTTYVLAVRSALPSTTWQTVVVEPDPICGCRFVINGGPGFSLVAYAEYNIGYQETIGRDRVVSDGWANGPYGRETVLEQLQDVRQISAEFFTRDGETSDASEFAAVQASPYPLWYRDPTGASWACSMTKPRRAMSKSKYTLTLDFTVTRIGDGPSLEDALTIVTADTIYADLIP